MREYKLKVVLTTSESVIMDGRIVLINDNYFEFDNNNYTNPTSEFWKQIRKGNYILNCLSDYIPEKSISRFMIIEKTEKDY